MSTVLCQKSFCEKGINSTKEWKQSVIAKKKELQDSGLIMTQIETHPEYTHLTQCKIECVNDKNEFITKEQCSRMFKPSKAKPKPNPKPKAASPVKPPQPEGQWDARGPKSKKPFDPFAWLFTRAKAKPPEPAKAKVKTPEPDKTKTPEPARAKTPTPVKPKTPNVKLPRCNSGTRRNPISKQCEPIKVKTPRAKTPKPATTKSPGKLPRCKPGTRRHPVLKICKPYPFQ